MYNFTNHARIRVLLLPSLNISTEYLYPRFTQREALAIAARNLTQSGSEPEEPHGTYIALTEQEAQAFAAMSRLQPEEQHDANNFEAAMAIPPRRQTDVRWLDAPSDYKGKTPSFLAVALANCSGERKIHFGPEGAVTNGNGSNLGPFFKYMPTDEEQAQLRADILREGRETRQKAREAKLKAMSEDEQKLMGEKAKLKKEKRAAARESKRARQRTETKPEITEAAKHRVEQDEMVIDRIHEILVECRQIDHQVTLVSDKIEQPPTSDATPAELKMYSTHQDYKKLLKSFLTSRKAEIGQLGEFINVEECRARRREAGTFHEASSWNERLTAVDMLLKVHKIMNSNDDRESTRKATVQLWEEVDKFMEENKSTSTSAPLTQKREGMAEE